MSLDEKKIWHIQGTYICECVQFGECHSSYELYQRKCCENQPKAVPEIPTHCRGLSINTTLLWATLSKAALSSNNIITFSCTSLH